MIIFPGNVLLRADLVRANSTLELTPKYKYKKNFGTVISSDRLKTGTKIFYFPNQYRSVPLEGKMIIKLEDVVLVRNKKNMQVLGTRLFVEPEKQAGETESGIKLSEAHLQYLPIGKVLAKGDATTKTNVGDRVFFDKDRSTDVSPYHLFENKVVYMVKEDDVLSIL
jgi:co-chaperonin GroES (HSP10)